MEQTNVLVTGGAGFMGSHVVDAILDEGKLAANEIVVLDDLSGGTERNVSNDGRVEFVLGSVTDAELVDRLFDKHKFAYVYHLAAYAAEGLSHFVRRFNYTNNLLGSVNLINAAVRHETRCFVFTSSIAVYGDAQSPLTEATTPRPIDPYGISKYAVELDLAAANDLYGLDYVIFRPHNVYGERQHLGDKYRNVVGIFMNCLLHDNPLPIFGDGTQQRAFTYISDVAPVIARSPLEPLARNDVFNVGSDDPFSINDLAGLVSDAFEMPLRVEHHEARHEVHVAFCNHEKIGRVFPEVGATNLVQGIERMAAWAKEAELRPGQRFDKLEVERNLPPSWRS